MDRKDLNVMKREQRTGKERQENQMVETKKERLEGFKGGEERRRKEVKQKSHMKELEMRKKEIEDGEEEKGEM